MKYYIDICSNDVFTFDEAKKIIGSDKNTKAYLSSLLRKNYIHKIKRGLYTPINITTKLDFASRFLIGSHINEDSFISLHSAFEFYGFYNQVYYLVYISSRRKFSSFDYDGYSYKYIQSKTNKQIDVIQGVKVTSIERTIVDSINSLGKYFSCEELLKCISLIHYIKIEKIKEMLLEYNKDVLFRKVGYILSFFKNDLNINDDFFDFCLSHSNIKNIDKISSNEIQKLDFISKWGLYAYKDLSKLINKDGEYNV